MALCPFATHKLIAPGSNDPKIRATQAILHVDAGGAASLFSYFRDRSGGIESHFHIKWSGEIEQYRDTAYEADANHLANPRAISIETQGFGNGRWNKRQLRSIKRLLVWLEATHGIPLQVCPAWDAPGVGYHVMFGAPGAWTPVAKSCPGPNRIKQFNKELVPWMDAVANPPAPVKRTRLTLITANLYRKNTQVEKDLAVLAATRAHAIALNEAHPFAAEIAAVEGYRAYYGSQLTEKVARTNPILMREDIKVTGEGYVKISEAVGKSPARAAVYVKYEYAGKKLALVNVHANSHVQRGKAKPYRLPRVREYIRGMVTLGNLVQSLEGQGYVVNVAGDLNWSYTPGPVQWLWSPRVVLGKLGYASQFGHKTDPKRPKGDQRRIEYVFYKPDEMTIHSQHFVGPERSDHPFHLVNFFMRTA